MLSVSDVVLRSGLWVYWWVCACHHMPLVKRFKTKVVITAIGETEIRVWLGHLLN